MDRWDSLAGLVTASSDSGGAGNLGLLFLLSGFVFYGAVYLAYRNVGKRHRYEVETEATKIDVTGEDRPVASLTDLTNSRMRGANNTAVRGSSNPLSALTGGGMPPQASAIFTRISQSIQDAERSHPRE